MSQQGTGLVHSLGKLSMASQCTDQFDLDGISEHIVSTFWMNPSKNPSKNPVSHCLKDLTEFFHNLIKMCPQCAWATHWESFQKIPQNSTTMYPTIYLISFLRVYDEIELHWDFVLNKSTGALWLNFREFSERTLNEWLRHIEGTFWSNYERNQWVLSNSGPQVLWWVLWWVHSKCTGNVLTDPIKIKLIGTLRGHW